ncbi:hypothetical protein LCGC14_1504530 [marine sediment metagenome]|uniref:Uncharacterized protein n=1 Tax=marine sediment metagenome TaxID=412755 RepID=A0A0F9M4G1_9ZZZZ
MRLILQRKGASLTVRSPYATTRCYEWNPRVLEVEVCDAQDIGYLLAEHGQLLDTDPPITLGWAGHDQDVSVTEELLSGEVTIPPGAPVQVTSAQEAELIKRRHWDPVPPTVTYEHGVRKLLVSRDMGMGDMLMLMPALRELKRQCPEIAITLSTHDAWHGMLEGQRGIHRIISMNGAYEYRPYDQHVNLVHWVEWAEGRYDRHRVDLFGSRLGLKSVPDKTVHIPLTRGERSAAKAAFAGLPRPIVGVALRGSTNARSYPLPMVLDFCQQLHAHGMTAALIDGAQQDHLELPAGSIRMCGTHTPRELAASVSAMDCMVAPDTGLVHIAAAVGIPIVALATGIPAELRWSAYKDVRVVDLVAKYGCEPCFDGPGCRPDGIGSESLTEWAPPCCKSLPPAELLEIVAEVVH